MRALLLLGLLALSACTIREESFIRDDGGPRGVSLAPLNLDYPGGVDDDPACTGGYARGSRIDEYRDGAASLFCD